MASSSSSPNNNKNGSVSSDPSSTHTTFVQADPSTFRALVQKLTGVTQDSATEKLPVTVPARQVGCVGPRKPAFKLQERRQQNLRKLEIKLLGGGVGSACSGGPGGGRYRLMGSEMVMISPVSPFDFVSRGSPTTPRSPEEEEERAIAEKGFYLHPSPLSTPRGAEPELLPLFPLHSPRDPPLPPPTSS